MQTYHPELFGKENKKIRKMPIANNGNGCTKVFFRWFYFSSFYVETENPKTKIFSLKNDYGL